MKPTYKEIERQLSESRREFLAADATINNLELRLAEMAARLAHAENKCMELAAENDELKAVESSLVRNIINDPGDTEFKYEKVQTPATDAFLAEVRSQGVEMAMEHMQSSGSLTFGDCYISLNEFAAKLRQEADK